MPRERSTALVDATFAFLHLRLEDVPSSLHEQLPSLPLMLTERGPVPIIEFLDDLEGPPARNDVPADKLPLDHPREFVVTGPFQAFHGCAKGRCARTDQLVKLVQVTARPFDGLQRLAQFPERSNRQIVGTFWSTVLRGWPIRGTSFSASVHPELVQVVGVHTAILAPNETRHLLVRLPSISPQPYTHLAFRGAQFAADQDRAGSANSTEPTSPTADHLVGSGPCIR
ncbi:hypothetical protein [Saccharopolyspora hattusasensis]|uniref:hypothetical protein n=1 Tax=Saccharopolyspora hattusasensis TaxID=1128679 RepID=UPI003D951A27